MGEQLHLWHSWEDGVNSLRRDIARTALVNQTIGV
jgi:hypothetical protein